MVLQWMYPPREMNSYNSSDTRCQRDERAVCICHFHFLLVYVLGMFTLSELTYIFYYPQTTPRELPMSLYMHVGIWQLLLFELVHVRK